MIIRKSALNKLCLCKASCLPGKWKCAAIFGALSLLFSLSFALAEIDDEDRAADSFMVRLNNGAPYSVWVAPAEGGGFGSVWWEEGHGDMIVLWNHRKFLARLPYDGASSTMVWIIETTDIGKGNTFLFDRTNEIIRTKSRAMTAKDDDLLVHEGVGVLIEDWNHKKVKLTIDMASRTPIKLERLDLNRFVAIKVLAPHLALVGDARQRFAREA